MIPTGPNPFHGIYPATLCPFTSDDAVDAAALARHVAGLVDVDGIVGVLCNGHAGENHLLSAGETRRVVEVVADTVFRGGTTRSLGAMPPGLYSYRASTGTGEVLATGRFDVSANSSEMIPTPARPEAMGPRAAAPARARGGRPLRTYPWPYLLLITLLCAEWVARRRTGLPSLVAR